MCHLEAVLGLRQALISQHLMALRKAKVLLSRREGRFIYYRLRDPQILDLVKLSGSVTGEAKSIMQMSREMGHVEDCGCPSCESAAR